MSSLLAKKTAHFHRLSLQYIMAYLSEPKNWSWLSAQCVEYMRIECSNNSVCATILRLKFSSPMRLTYRMLEWSTNASVAVKIDKILSKGRCDVKKPMYDVTFDVEVWQPYMFLRMTRQGCGANRQFWSLQPHIYQILLAWNQRYGCGRYVVSTRWGHWSYNVPRFGIVTLKNSRTCKFTYGILIMYKSETGFGNCSPVLCIKRWLV